ncbi:hypothetical protein T459_27045 [Capsicum annuum]|uniref:EF-hand domain-containing protein n=1 Tax=Capsicum annuum TaxID=4072 RepID=A0A2G2YCT4_CAPAN|nr:hypothetical protein T459_27045 [Capsicum annuum]
MEMKKFQHLAKFAPVNYNNSSEVSSDIGSGYFIDYGRGDDWELLKAHFQDNPKDLDLLKHDKKLRKKAPSPHLRDVPDYLLDPTTQEASKIVKLARAAMDDVNNYIEIILILDEAKVYLLFLSDTRVKAYTEGQQKEIVKIKELVPRVLKQIQNQVIEFEDLLKDDGSPNIESIKRFFHKFDDDHHNHLTPSELEKLTRNENAEKIDVCIDDENVNYLNRQDVRRALYARLVGVRSWDVCSTILNYQLLDIEIPTISIVGLLVKERIPVLIYRCSHNIAIDRSPQITLNRD